MSAARASKSPGIKLYQDAEERRRARRQHLQEFGERLRKATADLKSKTGRSFTHRQLATMLRERTGKPITARLVGRWYRGLAEPGLSRQLPHLTALADILGVNRPWLMWGPQWDYEQERPDRGIYRSGNYLELIDRRGESVGSVRLPAGVHDADAIASKCEELLDLLDLPPLRIA